MVYLSNGQRAILQSQTLESHGDGTPHIPSWAWDGGKDQQRNEAACNCQCSEIQDSHHESPNAVPLVLRDAAIHEATWGWGWQFGHIKRARQLPPPIPVVTSLARDSHTHPAMAPGSLLSKQLDHGCNHVLSVYWSSLLAGLGVNMSGGGRGTQGNGQWVISLGDGSRHVLRLSLVV